jgi:hypothetical protein
MTGGGGHVDQADDYWVRRTAWGLPVQFVLMPEQPSLRLVHRRLPGFPVPGSVAPDLDVTAACIPCCRAVAWLPGDRDRSRPPRMMGPVFSWPARHSHPGRGRGLGR